jgi:hypothetical protein
MGKFYKQMEVLYDMAEFSWAADYASKPGTMASILDRLITSKDTIEEIVEHAAAEGRKRGHRTKFSTGYIHGHIKFRIKQAAMNKKAK